MHTKIQGHWPFCSGEEDFRFLPYMAMAAILVMWPGPFEQTFVPPSHRSSIWNLTLISPEVSEEKMFKECGWRRTTKTYLSCKLTIWAFGSGELIKTPIHAYCYKTFKMIKYASYDIINWRWHVFINRIICHTTKSLRQSNSSTEDSLYFTVTFYHHQIFINGFCHLSILSGRNILLNRHWTGVKHGQSSW